MKPEDKLQLAMLMTGVSLDLKTCRIIIKVQKALKKMGKKYDLKTACKIAAEEE